MSTTAHEIESHIEHTRAALGTNIEELEQKVKSITDWEHQFQARPMALIGLAFGGGVILASILGGKRSSGPPGRRNSSDGPRGLEQSRAAETWAGIKGALLGVAASRFTDVVDGFVPGFKGQYEGFQGGAARSSSRPRADSF